MEKKEQKTEIEMYNEKEILQPKTLKGNTLLYSSKEIMSQALSNYIKEVDESTFMIDKKEKLSQAGKALTNLQHNKKPFSFIDTLKSIFMSEKINNNQLQETYNKDGFSKNRRSKNLKKLISKDPQYAEIFARDLEFNLKNNKGLINDSEYIRMERMLDYAKGIIEKDKQKTQLSNQQKTQKGQKKERKI